MKVYLRFIRPAPTSIYNCHNSKGVNLITQLGLGLSHLRKQNFKHVFQDSTNPLCNCGLDNEHGPLFVNARSTFSSNLNSLACNLLDNTDSTLTQTFLSDDSFFESNKNLKILMATNDYILSNKRFDKLAAATDLFMFFLSL